MVVKKNSFQVPPLQDQNELQRELRRLEEERRIREQQVNALLEEMRLRAERERQMNEWLQKTRKK